MEWETYFSSLPLDTRIWMLLGTKRYMIWVFIDRPSLAEFYSKEKLAEYELFRSGRVSFN